MNFLSGQKLRTVGDILGYEDISQTFKYAHLSPAHLAGAMEEFDKELLLCYLQILLFKTV